MSKRGPTSPITRKTKHPRTTDSNVDGEQMINQKVQELERRTEAIDRVVKRTAVWIYHFPVDVFKMEQSMQLSQKIDQLRQFMMHALKVPVESATKIEIRWMDIFYAKTGNDSRVKVDFVSAADKSELGKYLRNLATFNKDRKPPVIWTSDLTKEQLSEKKARFLKNKNKK